MLITKVGFGPFTEVKTSSKIRKFVSDREPPQKSGILLLLLMQNQVKLSSSVKNILWHSRDGTFESTWLWPSLFSHGILTIGVHAELGDAKCF